jgi:hypothetical protein
MVIRNQYKSNLVPLHVLSVLGLWFIVALLYEKITSGFYYFELQTLSTLPYLLSDLAIIAMSVGIALIIFNYKKAITSVISEKQNLNYLKISEIIKNSFSLALNNAGLIIGGSILWVLTAWIPYLNVGTTIGFLGIIVSISKGDSAFATEIFNAKYRKNMGEFFLLLSFMIVGITTGYAFVIIPGIVISIAWSQAILLFIDKGYSPLESIKKSNDITYGEKWTIFVGYLSLVLILGLSIGLLITLAVNVDEILALLVGLIGYIAFILVMIGCSAYIYGKLNKKLTAENN